MGSLASGGMWMASASGIAAGLAAGLMITAYGAFLPAIGSDKPEDCITVQASLEALHFGRDFVVWFLISGVLGLSAGSAPTLARLLFTVVPPHELSKNVMAGVQSFQGVTVLLGFLFLFTTTGDALSSAARHTPESVMDARKKIEAGCNTPTAPAVSSAPTTAPPATR
jgi:drug/metabolite transporter (DMT)-like permease